MWYPLLCILSCCLYRNGIWVPIFIFPPVKKSNGLEQMWKRKNSDGRNVYLWRIVFRKDFQLAGEVGSIIRAISLREAMEMYVSWYPFCYRVLCQPVNTYWTHMDIECLLAGLSQLDLSSRGTPKLSVSCTLLFRESQMRFKSPFFGHARFLEG